MSVEVGDVIAPVTVSEDTSILVQSEKENIAEAEYKLAVCEIDNTICVNAEIQEWVLTSDDIYIVSQTGPVPPWLEDLINNVVNSPDGLIVQDIEELRALINSLEEGFTNEIFRVDNELYTQTTELHSLKSSYDDTAAIVVTIDDTYASKDEARAISWTTIGSYFDEGAAAAWFESSVSTIANVAYSSARSASSLNASIITTNALAESIGLDVEILKKQVDGQVVTWFIDEATDLTGIGPFLPDDSINPDFKPYWCWLEGNSCPTLDPDDTLEDTRAYHTGDVLVWYRYVAGVKEIIYTAQFGLDPATSLYNWFIFTDDLASAAYEAALAAQATADSKIVTYYQNDAPLDIPVGTLGLGDFWVDADGFYVEGQDQLGDYPFKNVNVLSRWNGTSWILIEDKRINASVDRLDEATVTRDGVATAKGGLVTTAEGYISGYVSLATNDPVDPGSTFKIFADKFFIAGAYDPNYPAAGFSTAPFSIDTTVSPNVIKFNGVVEFSNILNPETVDLTPYMTNVYADEYYTRLTDLTVAGRTTINGNNITTGLLNASLIRTGVLDATYITTGYMSANRLSAGTIDANVITVKNLEADNIKSDSLTTTGIVQEAVTTVNTVYKTVEWLVTLVPRAQLIMNSQLIYTVVDDNMSANQTTSYAANSNVSVYHKILNSQIYGYNMLSGSAILTRLKNNSYTTSYTVTLRVNVQVYGGNVGTQGIWYGVYHVAKR